jgi:hypothetical protein
MATAKKTSRRAAAPAEGQTTYDVLSRLDFDGTIYEAGDQVALDDETAADLIKVNCVRAAAAPKAD